MSDHTNKKPTEKDQLGFLRLSMMKNRADFLRAAKGKRVHSNSFVLQAVPNADVTDLRVGFTCSKKVGNAVARNRAKRRLRQIANNVLPQFGARGMDYVLIGRADITATTPMHQMQDELEDAVKRISRIK